MLFPLVFLNFISIQKKKRPVGLFQLYLEDLCKIWSLHFESWILTWWKLETTFFLFLRCEQCLKRELELGFCSKNLIESLDIFEKYVLDPKFNNSENLNFITVQISKIINFQSKHHISKYQNWRRHKINQHKDFNN